MAISFNEISELNIESLKRSDLGSTLNFDEASPDVERIKNVFLFFKDKERYLTSNQIYVVSTVGQEFLGICSQIRDFTRPGEESQQAIENRRQDILRRIIDFSKRFDSTVLPLENYIEIKVIKSDDNLKQLGGKIKDLEHKASIVDNDFKTKLESSDKNLGELERNFTKKSEEVIGQVQNTLKEVDDIKRKAQDYSTAQVTSRFGTAFGEQASRNRRVANWSLFIFVFITIATVLIVWGLFKPLLDRFLNINDEKIMVEYTVTQVILRLTVLSILFLFIKESLRNFNINMHLYNVNRHRQNALESFTTFISNTDNDNTRDYLLKEVSKTIYSINRIGYLDESKGTFSFSQIIEIIKNLKP